MGNRKFQSIVVGITLWVFAFISVYLPAKRVQAQPIAEYTVTLTEIAKGAILTIRDTTIDASQWSNNGSRTVVRVHAERSIANLDTLRTELIEKGSEARQGVVVSSMVVLASALKTMSEKDDDGPEETRSGMAEYALLVALIAIGVIDSITTLGDAVENAFGEAADVLNGEESNCVDGIDNDMDGLVDCADTPCSTIDEICSIPVRETLCDDGVDNDNDQAIDCQDSDCANDPACAVPTEDCNNGQDDDGDGLVDCCDVNDCPIDQCQLICNPDEPF